MDMTEFQAVIESLQPLVGELTDGAIWIAGMYIGFKLLISLTVPLCIIWVIYRFGLMLKEWACKRKVNVNVTEKHVVLDRVIISSSEDALENIKEAFRICREDCGLFKSEYMHEEHAKFLLDAAKEKAARECK